MTEILDDNIIEKQPIRKPKIRTNIIWFGILMLGFIFKIMHWPFSLILFILGTSGLIAYNISCFLRLKGRHTGNNVILTFAAIWIFYLTYGFLGDRIPFLSLQGIALHGSLFIIIFAIYEFIEWRKSHKNKEA